MQTHVSEVAAIRERIAVEQMAGQLGLHGLNAGTARHEFITAKQERIGALHEELQGLVGDKAMGIIVETLANVPDTATRSDVLAVIRCELSDDAEVELFCNALQGAWQAIDLLKERLEDEQARKLLFAPPTACREISPS